MYEIFEKLLQERNIKTADVCRATGIKSPVFSEWKKGKSKPNVDKLILIANYFDVSVEFLRTGKETNKEKAKIDNQLFRQEKRLKEYMLKFANLSDDKRNQIMSLIDMLEDK